MDIKHELNKMIDKLAGDVIRGTMGATIPEPSWVIENHTKQLTDLIREELLGPRPDVDLPEYITYYKRAIALDEIFKAFKANSSYHNHLPIPKEFEVRYGPRD